MLEVRFIQLILSFSINARLLICLDSCHAESFSKEQGKELDIKNPVHTQTWKGMPVCCQEGSFGLKCPCSEHPFNAQGPSHISRASFQYTKPKKLRATFLVYFWTIQMLESKGRQWRLPCRYCWKKSPQYFQVWNLNHIMMMYYQQILAPESCSNIINTALFEQSSSW